MKKGILYFILSTLWSFAGFAEITPAGLTQECRQFLAKLPPSYRRGWIQVPENWQRPGSRSLAIFYYTRIQPSQEPVLFLNGGPLGTDHYSYPYFEKHETPTGISFVYVDQRGTGCSSQVGTGSALEMARGAFMASDEISYDLEKLKISLFGQDAKWKIFGQSFGGYILNRYITLFPKSVLAAYNYSGGFTEDFVGFFSDRIFRQIWVVQHLYRTQTVERMKFVRSRFSNATCVASPTGKKVCGSALAQLYFEEGLTYKEGWAEFESDLYNKVLLPNQEVDLEYVKKKVGFGYEFFFTNQFLIATALWRQESVTSYAQGPNTIDCQKAYLVLAAKGIDIRQSPLNHCLLIEFAFQNFDPSLVRQVMNAHPVRGVLSQHRTLSIVAQKKIPYFYYTGEFDIYGVGLEMIINASKTIPNIQFVSFRGQDHFGYFDEAKFWSDLNRRF